MYNDEIFDVVVYIFIFMENLNIRGSELFYVIVCIAVTIAANAVLYELSAEKIAMYHSDIENHVNLPTDS